ncbi:type I secretion system permease/ATPase [Endozoicomonas sp. OPT23]|uniref:ATP-binding cassette domain-containing protein n=1 Tax=Endozoicomonas sp. OPT23 TaxID=2072845 RepID=UPI00129A2FBE|nr:ATP-binding cassette domain-containing protein [Endozoicomonas sp. OPT23]MRI35080.1 type I secretion system permease/ATPase [Endozoicomonas sp. OPT23]
MSERSGKTHDRGDSIYGWFWQAVSPYRHVYRDVWLASLLINLFAFVSPLFVMNVYDRVVPNGAFETLWMLAAGACLAFSLEFAIRLLRTRFVDQAGRQIDLTLSSRLIDRILGLKLSFRPGSTGALMNSLSEFDSVRAFITSTTVMAFIDLPFVVLFLALVVWIGGWMVAVPILCITLSLFMAWLVNKPLQAVVTRQQKAASARQNYLMELLIGLVTVKSCNVQRQSQQRWSRLNREAADAGFGVRKLQAIPGLVTTFLLQLNTLALVVYGVYLITSAELTMGGLIAITMIAGRCGAPVAQVISLLNQYEKTIHALEHAGGVMSLPQEVPEGRQLLKPNSFSGAWRLNKVSFGFSDETTNLCGMTMEIPSGSKLAVLGRMGSGKTTLLQLLAGFQEAKEGHIAIDGIDIRQIEPAWLRRQIGYVPQNIDLFNDTLRENIAMGRTDVSDADILKALDMAGLSDIVRAGSQGLDFQVGERGRHLSGGQAQAVGLARALVACPGALILDEPTSAMDSQAEQQFLRLLKQLENITIILVTHKLHLLKAMDNIVVIEQGEIKAMGSADDVMGQLAGHSKSKGSAG